MANYHPLMGFAARSLLGLLIRGEDVPPERSIVLADRSAPAPTEGIPADDLHNSVPEPANEPDLDTLLGQEPPEPEEPDMSDYDAAPEPPGREVE